MTNLRLLPLCGLLALAGCATTPREVPPEVLLHQETTTARLMSNGAGLVTDGCILSVGAATTYAYLEASTTYAAAVSETFGAYLKARGIAVRTTVIPFLCGYLNNEQTELKVARDEDSDAAKANLPFLLDERLRKDARLAMAYSELITKAKPIQATNAFASIAETEQVVDISPELAQILIKDIGSPYVFLAATGGNQISGGRKVFAAMTTGLITGLLTGGAGMGISVPQTATGHSLALIDLAQRKALWKTMQILTRVDPLEAAHERQVSLWRGAMTEPFLRAPRPALAAQAARTVAAVSGSRSDTTSATGTASRDRKRLPAKMLAARKKKSEAKSVSPN